MTDEPLVMVYAKSPTKWPKLLSSKFGCWSLFEIQSPDSKTDRNDAIGKGCDRNGLTKGILIRNQKREWHKNAQLW